MVGTPEHWSMLAAHADPWPGMWVVAIGSPVLAVSVVMLSNLGVFGWLSPWVLGATPIAALLLPLAWRIFQSRMAVLSVDLRSPAVQVVWNGNSLPDPVEVGLAYNRLTWGEVDLRLEPLRIVELTQLRESFESRGVKVHTARPSPTLLPQRSRET